MNLVDVEQETDAKHVASRSDDVLAVAEQRETTLSRIILPCSVTASLWHKSVVEFAFSTQQR